MDLVGQVTEALDVTEQQAGDGVGLLLFAVRFGTDQRTFDAVKQVYPEAQSLVTRALAAGGRTAEMLAVANPAAVKKNLVKAGYAESDLDQLGQVVGVALAAELDDAVAARVRATIDEVTAA